MLYAFWPGAQHAMAVRPQVLKDRAGDTPVASPDVVRRQALVLHQREILLLEAKDVGLSTF
jgi:hypothetical protein